MRGGPLCGRSNCRANGQEQCKRNNSASSQTTSTSTATDAKPAMQVVTSLAIFLPATVEHFSIMKLFITARAEKLFRGKCCADSNPQQFKI
jgi:hypothetical protein